MDIYKILENVIYYYIGFLTIVILLATVASCGTLKYYIKFTLFAVVATIPTTLHVPFMFLRIRDWRNALLSAWFTKHVFRFLGVTFRIRGKENIVKDSGSIVLINHQSIIDLCVLAELWPLLKRCTVIAKKEVLYFGIIGLASWLWGTIFINREKAEEAQNAINATATCIKDLQANLLIFPEGHRHSNSTLLPLKKGAFHLAVASQMPIQPIIVSKYYFLNSKRKRFSSGVSYITILPPISAKGLTKADIPKLMEDTYQVMNKSFVETSEDALNEYVNSLRDGE